MFIRGIGKKVYGWRYGAFWELDGVWEGMGWDMELLLCGIGIFYVACLA